MKRPEGYCASRRYAFQRLFAECHWGTVAWDARLDGLRTVAADLHIADRIGEWRVIDRLTGRIILPNEFTRIVS